MRSRLLSLLPALLLAAPAAAARGQTPGASAARDTTVALAVTLDRPAWIYRAGDTARFTVSLRRAGAPVPGARVRVDLAPERMRPLRTDTVDVERGPRTIAGSLAAPGFLRATASVVVGGATYTAMATAAFDPERIEPTATMPDDFEAFWRKAVEDARRVPLDARMTRMPERSTPEVDVYHVSFQNHRAGSRLYGILSMPARPGKYPAVLVVPGAGVRPYYPSIAVARRGVIVLTIGIHGIPVDRDSLLYNELRASALADYMRAGIEDRDTYYYKRVFAGVVKAGDFLFALPQFDGGTYAVLGGSQGGALAIVAGAIDPRVKGIVASYPALADHFGYLHGRAGGWPHVFADTTRVRALAEKKETLRYYDVVNFARLLKVPGIYAWGFNDLTVPPTSVYAAYNVITAPKRSVIVPETGHFRVESQTKAMDAWMFDLLGVPNR